jgi:hypothetical protein
VSQHLADRLSALANSVVGTQMRLLLGRGQLRALETCNANGATVDADTASALGEATAVTLEEATRILGVQGLPEDTPAAVLTNDDASLGILIIVLPSGEERRRLLAHEFRDIARILANSGGSDDEIYPESEF